MNTTHARLIILGSGPAGYTAGVYAARANLEPVLISGFEQGGQLMTTTDVDNWPGGETGLQGPHLMEQMLAHVERYGTRVVNDQIVSGDLGQRPFQLTGELGAYTCDALIIATGASAMYLGLESEDAYQGTRRLGLRHVRRLFLQGPGCRRHRRRQHRSRGGAVSFQPCQAGHTGAPARCAARREDPAGRAVRQGKKTATSP